VRLGAARVVVRTDGVAMVKGFGGGTMACGDPPIDRGGDVGISLEEGLGFRNRLDRDAGGSF